MKLLIKNNEVIGKYPDNTYLEFENESNKEYEVCYVPANYTPNNTYTYLTDPSTGLKIQQIFKELSPKPLPNDVALESIRIKRNILLSQTDWVMMSDVSLPKEQKDAYKQYRQELRDLPDTFADNPNDVVWPVKP